MRNQNRQPLVFLALSLFCFQLLLAQKMPKVDVTQPAPLPEKIVVDNYHGMEVKDPYRFMENLNDPVVLNWLKENTAYAQAVMDAIPGKELVKQTIMEFMQRDGEQINGYFVLENGNYFYKKLTPPEDFAKLYYRDSFNSEEHLIFDPTTYNKDSNDRYDISSVHTNKTGEKIAVVVAPNGTETSEILILNKSGELLEAPLKLGRSISWLPTNDAFVYTKMNSEDVKDMSRKINTNVYLHKLGTPQSADQVFFSREMYPQLDVKPEEIPSVRYDKDGQKLILYANSVESLSKAFIADYVANEKQDWQPLTKLEDNILGFWIAEDAIYYRSLDGAPNIQIVKTPLSNTDLSKATTVIPESTDEKITDFAKTSDGIFYATSKNNIEANVYFLKDGTTEPKKLELPFGAGSAVINSVNSKNPQVWITISGWTSPDKRYKYYPLEDKFVFEPITPPVEFPEMENYTVKEVMVKSHDGVMVPASIIHIKDIKLDGSNIVVMNGYGAYGSTTEPSFNPLIMLFGKFDAILVFAHVRGGGELGEAWHKAGQKLTKPNTWKDAIAIGEYMIKEGYTTKDKLTLFGGSAGGILVGRAITERPDLFRAVSPQVGVMNTVRGEDGPNGPVNAPEFGTVKDADEFKGLLEMDSYHHIEEGVKYPALYITAGMNDNRVIAWQPAKFASRIQEANASKNPILFNTDFDAGHGQGMAMSSFVERFSNLVSFLLWQAGHPEFQP